MSVVYSVQSFYIFTLIHLKHQVFIKIWNFEILLLRKKRKRGKRQENSFGGELKKDQEIKD